MEMAVSCATTTGTYAIYAARASDTAAKTYVPIAPGQTPKIYAIHSRCSIHAPEMQSPCTPCAGAFFVPFNPLDYSQTYDKPSLLALFIPKPAFRLDSA